MAALRRCIGLDPALFAARYWGRAALRSRIPAGFTDLLDLAGVDELLSRRGLRTPFLRLAREGRVLPAADYTGGGGAGAEIGDQVRDEKVLAAYADGATLVLQGLHRTWPPLVAFAGQLGTDLGSPVQANAYLTPAANRGFATHYDTHDVFVLQVEGRKRWRVHEPVLADPLERQRWDGVADEVAATADGPPAIDTELTPGDSLYLPRGWLHSAEALGEPSLHITLGVRALNRFAVVEALLALAAEEPALRAGFPLGLDSTDPAALAPELASTVEALQKWLAGVGPAAVAERLLDRVWAAARPAPIAPIAQAELARTATVDTVVTVRPGLRWRLAPGGDGRCVLRLAGRSIDIPDYCRPALQALLAGAPVRVGDLPGLDVEDQQTFARRMLREAVAVPA